MIRFEDTSITKTLIFLIMFLTIPGYCLEIKTVQGTDIIKNISDNIDSCAAEIRTEEYQKAEELLEDISRMWQDFQSNHNEIFAGEIEKIEQLPVIFSGISEALDKTCSQIDAGEFEAVEPTLDSLHKLLTELLELIDLPVMLDFTGPKCKACKTMKNRLPHIASDYKNKIRIAFIDANKEKDLVKRYKIMLIPTLIFITRSGEEIERHIGDMEDRTIRAKLEELID